jgi:hypothetical protein
LALGWLLSQDDLLEKCKGCEDGATRESAGPSSHTILDPSRGNDCARVIEIKKNKIIRILDIFTFECVLNFRN